MDSTPIEICLVIISRRMFTLVISNKRITKVVKSTYLFIYDILFDLL